jgi:hypothetical protein
MDAHCEISGRIGFGGCTIAREWIRSRYRGRCGRGERRFSRVGALARQAQIFVLTFSVESLRLESHFVSAYPVGNDRATVIADKRYFDH